MDIPTGTLIAAALETVGYHSQAQILEGLTQMIFQIGVLFYILALLASATVYVITSSVRQALWLVVAPGLFYFLVFIRIEAPGAKWVFGTYDDERDGFNSLPTVVSFDEDAEVSWFFNRWNLLVSNVYKELVKIVTSYDSFRAQVRFMTRARLSDIVFRAEIQDPGLEALVVHGLSSYCGDAMNAMRDIAYARSNPTYAYSSPSLQLSLATLPALYKGQHFAFPQNSPARIYLVNLLSRLSTMTTERDLLMQTFCEGDTEAGDALDVLTPGTDFEQAITAIDCRQLWCWTAIGTYFEAIKIAELAECKYTPKLLHMCTESDLLKSALDTQRRDIMHELWADIAIKLLSPKMVEDAGITVDSIDLRYIPLIITGSMLRRALTIDPRTYLPTEYAQASGYATGSSSFDMTAVRNRDLDSSRTLDARHELAASMRFESFIFLSRIPYVQGGILFGLAVLFPFFALFVLIPGKARVIITWMALWAWIKSWDVGYAMVMVADDILWSLIPFHSQYVPLLESANGPLAFLEGAFRSDPSYSLSTYYMLLAAMIMAVPMVTAQFILGMQSAIGGVMLGRMYGLGSRLQDNQTVLARRRLDDSQQAKGASSPQGGAATPSAPAISGSPGDTTSPQLSRPPLSAGASPYRLQSQQPTNPSPMTVNSAQTVKSAGQGRADRDQSDSPSNSLGLDRSKLLNQEDNSNTKSLRRDQTTGALLPEKGWNDR